MRDEFQMWFKLVGDQPVPITALAAADPGVRAFNLPAILKRLRGRPWSRAGLLAIHEAMIGDGRPCPRRRRKPAEPKRVGFIDVPADVGADAGIILAADPLDPGRNAHTALVNLKSPGPITPGMVCVVDLPIGPVLRRVYRRGGRLLLRTSDGRFAGVASIGVHFIPCKFAMSAVT